jgi:hypothetical protein
VKENPLKADEETSISELTIAPDGRVFIFGASRQVLQLFDDLNLGDPALKRRIDHVRALEADGSRGSRRRRGQARPGQQAAARRLRQPEGSES